MTGPDPSWLEPGDVAVLKMMAGASFGPDATLTLPSGRVLSADEAQALAAVYAPAFGYDTPVVPGPSLLGLEESASGPAPRPLLPEDKRRIELEMRHRIEIEPYDERPARLPFVGVLLVFMGLALWVAACMGWVVWAWER